MSRSLGTIVKQNIFSVINLIDKGARILADKEPRNSRKGTARKSQARLNLTNTLTLLK